MASQLSLHLYSLANRFKPQPSPINNSALKSPQSAERILFFISSHGSLPIAERLWRDISYERPQTTALFISPPSLSLAYNEMENAEHAQMDLDTPQNAQLLLQAVKPSMCVWIGGHFHPIFLKMAKKKSIPLLSIEAWDCDILVDAPSFYLGLKKQTLNLFDHVIAHEQERADMWTRNGFPKHDLHTIGPLASYDQTLEIDQRKVDEMSKHIGSRPCWFAANLHPEEITPIIQAHKSILRKSHRALLAISLNDDISLNSLIETANKNNLSIFSESNPEQIVESDQIIFINKKDNDIWHRLSPISFLGGSLADTSGIDINPYPAAAMGSAIINGPHFEKENELFARLKNADANYTVNNGTDLRNALIELFDANKAALYAMAAWKVISDGAEASEYVNNLVQDILDTSERSPQ